MPFKNREKYLEYQRSYYKKSKGNPASIHGSNSEDISNLGLTAGLNRNVLNPKSSVQSPSKKQDVTSTLNHSIPKPSIPTGAPFPLNPVKPARNRIPEEHVDRGSANVHAANHMPVWSDQIAENTRKHVEELKKTDGKLMTLGMREELLRTKIIKQVSTFSESRPALRIAAPVLGLPPELAKIGWRGFGTGQDIGRTGFCAALTMQRTAATHPF